MSIEAVKKAWNKADDIIEFEASSTTVEWTVQALDVEPETIAKTLAMNKGLGHVKQSQLQRKKYPSHFNKQIE